jgi:hypothetical protein
MAAASSAARSDDRPADCHGVTIQQPSTIVIPTVRAQEPYGNRVSMMGGTMSRQMIGWIERRPTRSSATGRESSR